jgi:hypothetical protein
MVLLQDYLSGEKLEQAKKLLNFARAHGFYISLVDQSKNSLKRVLVSVYPEGKPKLETDHVKKSTWYFYIDADSDFGLVFKPHGAPKEFKKFELFMKHIQKDSISKEAMPKLDTKEQHGERGIDLYFEFLNQKDRQHVVEDLINGKTIELPSFGEVDKDRFIVNTLNKINKEDIKWGEGNFTERMIRDMIKSKSKAKPFLEYDDVQHKYKLRPKYDLEKMLKEVTEKKPAN